TLVPYTTLFRSLADPANTSAPGLFRRAPVPHALAGADHPRDAGRVHQLRHATAMATHLGAHRLVQRVHHRPAVQRATATGRTGRCDSRLWRPGDPLDDRGADPVHAVSGLYPDRQADGGTPRRSRSDT